MILSPFKHKKELYADRKNICKPLEEHPYDRSKPSRQMSFPQQSARLRLSASLTLINKFDILNEKKLKK